MKILRKGMQICNLKATLKKLQSQPYFKSNEREQECVQTHTCQNKGERQRQRQTDKWMEETDSKPIGKKSNTYMRKEPTSLGVKYLRRSLLFENVSPFCLPCIWLYTMRIPYNFTGYIINSLASLIIVTNYRILKS